MGTYVERPVDGALAALVVCTWADAGGKDRHTVLPDACIDIVWDGRRLTVVGPDTGPVRFPDSATFAGIRFRPGVAPGFLHLPACELTDRRVPLAELWGRDAVELEERIAARPRAVAGLLEGALLDRAATAAPTDPVVAALLDELNADGYRGHPVRAAARRFEIGERTLQRRCVAAFGYGPKTLYRILRFRRALWLGRTATPAVAVAAGSGYADQSHLTHEFRRLAGSTPAEIFSASNVVISANGTTFAPPMAEFSKT